MSLYTSSGDNELSYCRFEHLNVSIGLVERFSHRLEVAVVLIQPELRYWLIRLPSNRPPGAWKVWNITRKPTVGPATTASDADKRSGLWKRSRLSRRWINGLCVVKVTHTLCVCCSEQRQRAKSATDRYYARQIDSCC